MHDPIAKFSQWFADAKASPAITEPTAMTLATATAQGKPSARIVLLKEHGPQGFLFYTNLTSRKSGELIANPQAAVCFYWMPLCRQLRIEGTVVQAADAEADAYFASRPRERQIGAWASLQSQPLRDRAELDERAAMLEKRYAGQPIPRPPHWSGWRLIPRSMEFWLQSEARLHEREIYTRADAHAPWQFSLLYP
ncbi:MAG: pyridoxamine 5'-phosphate oxidase [Pseudomonadota bacterium]